jgi:hypothetical protein
LVSIDDCTRTMAELLIAITEIEERTARRDRLLARVSARSESAIDAAKVRRIEAETALKNYYCAHLVEIEKDGAKHLQLANGVIGRRYDPPALKPLNRAWSMKAIKAAVRAKWGALYFHLPAGPELKKGELKKLAADDLKGVGLKVENEETFYAEPERAPVAASQG